MSEIVVAGHLLVDPAVRESYLADCVAIVELGRSADGCLDFVISADIADPSRVNIFERWSSREQLEAFRGSGPPPAQLELIQHLDVHEYVVSS